MNLNKLRQLFCWHKWKELAYFEREVHIIIENRELVSHYTVLERKCLCVRCGKTKYV